MNFSMFWPGSKGPQTKKRIRPKSNFKSSQLGRPSQEEEHTVNPFDEIRRQAVSMSSSRFELSTLSPTSKPMKDQKVQVKSARKPPSKTSLQGKPAERPPKTTTAQ